jgi:hypothetical protein
MKMLFKNPYLWWKFEGRYYHKDLYKGIKNLIQWFPVIWKDRDWDSYYIFRILEHKLKLQAKGISKRDIHMNAQRDAGVMMTCVRLMEKVRNGYYESEYLDYYKTKMWFEDIEDSPGYSTMKSEMISEKFDDLFKKYKLIHRRVLGGEGPFTLHGRDEADVKRIVAMNICHINQKRAQDLLFKVMNESINGWWD